MVFQRVRLDVHTPSRIQKEADVSLFHAEPCRLTASFARYIL